MLRTIIWMAIFWNLGWNLAALFGYLIGQTFQNPQYMVWCFHHDCLVFKLWLFYQPIITNFTKCIFLKCFQEAVTALGPSTESRAPNCVNERAKFSTKSYPPPPLNRGVLGSGVLTLIGMVFLIKYGTQYLFWQWVPAISGWYLNWEPTS